MVFFLLFLHKMWYGSPGVFLMERRAGIWRLVLGNANKAKGGRTEKDEGRKRRGTDGSEQATKQGGGRKRNGRVAFAIGGAKPGSRFLSRTGVKKWESRVSFLILKIS